MIHYENILEFKFKQKPTTTESCKQTYLNSKGSFKTFFFHSLQDFLMNIVISVLMKTLNNHFGK